MSRYSLVKVYILVFPLGPYYRDPLPLDTFIIIVEIHKTLEGGFEDPLQQLYPIFISFFINNEFGLLLSKKLRTSYLFYELFGNWIKKIFGIHFTKTNYEFS
jgi:hypothetical protein